MNVTTGKRFNVCGKVISEQDIHNMIREFMGTDYKHNATFLDPLCEQGRVLIAMLNTKLNFIKKENTLDFERKTLIAISSLYGFDTQEKNVIKARENLFNTWKDFCSDVSPEIVEMHSDLVREILNKNIIVGNMITKTNGDNKPIVLSQWIETQDRKMLTSKEFTFV